MKKIHHDLSFERFCVSLTTRRYIHLCIWENTVTQTQHDTRRLPRKNKTDSVPTLKYSHHNVTVWTNSCPHNVIYTRTFTSGPCPQQMDSPVSPDLWIQQTASLSVSLWSQHFSIRSNKWIPIRQQNTHVPSYSADPSECVGGEGMEGVLRKISIYVEVVLD